MVLGWAVCAAILPPERPHVYHACRGLVGDFISPYIALCECVRVCIENPFFSFSCLVLFGGKKKKEFFLRQKNYFPFSLSFSFCRDFSSLSGPLLSFEGRSISFICVLFSFPFFYQPPESGRDYGSYSFFFSPGVSRFFSVGSWKHLPAHSLTLRN